MTTRKLALAMMFSLAGFGAHAAEWTAEASINAAPVPAKATITARDGNTATVEFPSLEICEAAIAALRDGATAVCRFAR